MSDLPELTEFEREVYSSRPVTGFGRGPTPAQGATVMISRVGLGGLVAYELAAAGVGRLVRTRQPEAKLEPAVTHAS